MKKQLFVLIGLLLSMVASAQNYSADKLTARQSLTLGGKPVSKIITSSPDSLIAALSLTDDALITVKAMYEYINKRLAACGCNAPVAVPLIVSQQPSGATLTVGQNVAFAAAASGGITPYSYQWKKAGVNIIGANSATYSISNVQLTDSGSYRVSITDAINTAVQSNAAQLVVSSVQGPILAYYGYSSVDPFINATTAPSVTYSGSVTVSHNAAISFTLPQAAGNQFLVFKVPVGESVKTAWFNTSFNQGTIEDAVLRASYTVGAFTYYVTRSETAIDYTQAFILQ